MTDTKAARRLPDTPQEIVALWLQVDASLAAKLRPAAHAWDEQTWERTRARATTLPRWELLAEAAAANKRYNQELESGTT